MPREGRGRGRLAGWPLGSIGALLCLLPAAFCGGAPSPNAPASIAGFPADEALLLGERMYRQGVGIDGKPLKAIVAGDVAVDGTMFTCVNCHRRSGIGSREGPIIAWPVNGKELAVPRRRAGAWNPSKQHQGPGAIERWSLPPRFQMADVRPAYTDETLAEVLRTGIDPAGRVLKPVMPRYDLGEREMAVLIYYLKNLSTDIDPGADEQTIRFATVVTEGVDEADRDAMLAVLQAHIDARNTQTRPYERRARAGPFYKTEKYGAYRKLALDVWELKGPPDTWRAQLETYYRSQPVFALLGGITAGSWAPVHEFCEENEIPSILPITDQPVVSNTDWYTLYFSKGLYQEGEAAARFVANSDKLGKGVRILQVFRSGSKGEDAARGFSETWEKQGGISVESRQLGAGEELSAAPWLAPEEEHRPTVALLWLDGAEVVAALNGVLAQGKEVEAVFSSWSLVRKDLGRIPETARDRLYLTYPYILPGEEERRWRAVGGWLKARKFAADNPDIQGKMYFLGWMLPGAIDYIRSEFYRDYFLEGFDMMPDQTYAVPNYPRLSFGPGQRYLAKGCYVVQLTEGNPPKLVRRSKWVTN